MQEEQPFEDTAKPIDEGVPSLSPAQSTFVEEVATRIHHELAKVIVGQREMIDFLLAGIFIGGHVLIEGVPGIAKTLTAKLLSKTLALDYTRIQFTPDLMPTDVLGTSIFNVKESDFTFKPGPIFANVILIDEINRSPAKTQAALFEVMEERQVTVDGQRHDLSAPFFVIATQNPIEQEGTYKLPEAQLDRFLFKIVLDYPTLDGEKTILRRFRSDFNMTVQDSIQAVCTKADIQRCMEDIQGVTITDELIDYIAAIVYGTRNNPDVFLGASPRASLAMLKSAKAIAAMRGRKFVTPDDIQFVAYPVLNHRIILTPEREMEGFTARHTIEAIVKGLDVPR